MVRVWPKNAQSRATHIVESSHSPIRTTTPTSFLPSLLRALPIYDSLERENRFHLEREKAMVDADALWETKRFSYSVSRLNFGGMWGFSFFILWGLFFFFSSKNWIEFILFWEFLVREWSELGDFFAGTCVSLKLWASLHAIRWRRRRPEPRSGAGDRKSVV